MNVVTRKDLFNSIKKIFIKIVKESLQTGWDLTKIMVPILIVTKILQEFGAVALLGKILNPLMGWVGLPGGMALVWGMAILISPYGGLILYASLASQYPLTVAQATVLAALILMAHAMPLEIRIAQKAGLRISLQLILRVGGAFLFGWLLHQFYSLTGYLQTPNQAVFNITQQDPTWLGWGLGAGEEPGNHLSDHFQSFISNGNSGKTWGSEPVKTIVGAFAAFDGHEQGSSPDYDHWHNLGAWSGRRTGYPGGKIRQNAEKRYFLFSGADVPFSQPD